MIWFFIDLAAEKHILYQTAGSEYFTTKLASRWLAQL